MAWAKNNYITEGTLISIFWGTPETKAFFTNWHYETKSDNTIYEPYEVNASEVLKIWRYACSIATQEFEQYDLGD